MSHGKDWIATESERVNGDKIAQRETSGGWRMRLVQAQRVMAGVPKASKVAFGNQRYAYTSAEDMIAACRAALMEAELALTRSWNIEWREDHAILISEFTLHDKNDSVVMGRVPFPIIGTSGKGDDKAVATALTSSLSYFLRDLLLVPKSDDAAELVRAPEMDARDDRAVQTKLPKPTKKRSAQFSAAELDGRLADIGQTRSDLLSAMSRAGIEVNPETDPAQWPSDLANRVERWIALRQTAVTKP